MGQMKFSPPGRMMTSAPAKAPSTSSQRSRDTCSPSMRPASSVMISGTSELMAVKSATGRYCRLPNAKKLLVKSSKPRKS